MSPKKHSRWAGYVRVSKVGGRSGERYLSPKQQREAIERWAEYRGVELVAVYQDEDQSGGKMRRKEFNRMLASAERGELDGIVVAKVDRFARTLVGAITVLDKMKKWGVDFTSVAENIDTSTSQGKLFLNLLLVFAEFELDRIRDQWQDATEDAVRRGVFVRKGRHFGYDRDENGRLHVNPTEAPVVHDIFVKRAQRLTFGGIAERLNVAHPRADGKRWTHQGVKTIIRSRVYVGESSRGDIINRNAHEPIVTLAEWDAANSITGGPGAVKNSGDMALLAGLIRCAGCRYGMRRVNSPTRTGPVAGYVCGRKHGAGVCDSPAYVKAEDVELMVTFLFLYWHGEATRQPYRADVAAVEGAEGKLEDMERRYNEVAADDRMREIMGERFYVELQRRADEIEAAQTQLAEARAAVELHNHTPILLASDWDAADSRTRHNMLRRAIDSVYVRRGSDPLNERVLIKWSGEDEFERPERGKSDYALGPVPWPHPITTAEQVIEHLDAATIGPTERALANMIVEHETPQAAALSLANMPAWARSNFAATVSGYLPPELQAGLGKLNA